MQAIIMKQVNPEKTLSLELVTNELSGSFLLSSNQDSFPKISFRGVSCSSSFVADGPWIFVAIPGTKNDGHSFITDAIKNGAGAVIISDPKYSAQSVPTMLVADTRKALSKLSALICGHPSRQLNVVGITGTNGKTTTNWLIHHAFGLMSLPSIRIGTLGFAYPGEGQEIIGDTGLTTPDASTIHQVLAQGYNNSAKAAVLEVSSHALSQHRASAIEFDVAIFTNLTRDHLDFHSSIEEYKEAKWHLFELLALSKKQKKIAVINYDSEVGREFCERIEKQYPVIELISFGRHKDAKLKIINEIQTFSGSSINYLYKGSNYTADGAFIGAHNAENIAAVLGAIIGLGLPVDQFLQTLELIPPVPGRLEPVSVAPHFGIFVDYAHSPDALERVLQALRPLTKGKLSVLFGCGGDRDRGKRPLMRKVATSLADRVWVTSDNPRTENPTSIIREILEGSTSLELVKIDSEPDRRLAINKSLSELVSGDILLVAGKGHEDYQIIGSTKHHFSDAEVIRDEFALLQRTNSSGIHTKGTQG